MIDAGHRTTRSRSRRRTALAALALLHALLLGCGAEDTREADDSTDSDEDGSEPSGSRDAGRTSDDAGRKDAGSTKDGGGKDAGSKDAGRDSGRKDSGSTEDDDPGETPTPGRNDAGTPGDRADASTPTRDAGTGTPDVRRDASTPRPDAGRDSGRPSDPDPTPDPTDAGSEPSDPPDVTPPSGNVCTRWKTARADLSEGKWSGDAATCSAGDMTPAARDNALRLMNLYRSLAGLGPVTMSAEGNRLAQACALLMRANNTITHAPPSSFKCYTAEAAKTAGGSSLSSGPAVSSVDGYMIDPGNPTTIGHRRWILSSWLTEVGFGSADRFSCQYQPVKSMGAKGAKAWVAWPPEGEVPLQAFGSRYGGQLDQTGWTVQSDSINLRGAQVSVKSGGSDLPVTVTQLGSGYGSTYAIRFAANGWTTKVGSYHVEVSGVPTPISYDVKVVDCP